MISTRLLIQVVWLVCSLSFQNDTVIAFLPATTTTVRHYTREIQLFQQAPRQQRPQSQRPRSQRARPGRRQPYTTKGKQQRSRAFLEANSFLRSSRSPHDILQWLEHRRDHQLTFYPHEQTEFIRDLASRRAYDAILYYLQHFSDHSVYVYTSAISSLSKSNNHSPQALALLSNMTQTPNKYTFTALFNHIRGPRQAKRFFQSLDEQYSEETVHCLEVYNAAIHACTKRTSSSSSSSTNDNDKNSSWQTALQFYLQLKKRGLIPSHATYSSLLSACGQAGQVKIAMTLLDDMPMAPNDVVWGAALTVCARVGDVPQATALLRRMRTITSRHVGAYISALAKGGDDGLALTILEALKEERTVQLDDGLILHPVPLDLVIINTVLYACAKVKNYGAARRILAELKNDEYTTDGAANIIRPDEITYNTVLSACTDAQEARALVKEMRSSRRHRYNQVPPTAKTYTVAIKACKSDFDTALFLLRDAKHDGIDPPNVFMYSAAIWTAERCGRVDDAMALLEEMKTVGGCQPNDVSYGGVIAALAADGQAENAIDLLAEMKTFGIRTNERVFSRIVEAIQIAAAKDENVDKIELLESVVKLMNGKDFSVEMAGPLLETLILEYGKNNRLDDALSIFDMIYGPTNGPCLRAILSACALTKGRWEDALAIVHTSDIVEGAGGPARVDMRAIGFAMLSCSKSGEWREAMNLLELYGRQGMEHNSCVPRSAVNSLITACGRGGRPDMALRLLNAMESRYGVAPNEISYRSAAIACNQAQHEVRRRENLGMEPRRKDESQPIQWWECSLSLLRRMKEEGLQSDAQTCSSVISACEAAGEWQRALGVLRDMPGELNLYCFNAAISACQKGGAWVEALELYYQMMETGGVVTPNFVTLSCLLIALDEAGQKELAQDLYKEGLKKHIMKAPWTRTRSGRQVIRAMDLHNFSVAMTRAAIRSVLESLVNDGKPACDVTKELVIIVGKGKGSKADPVLMPTVKAILDDDYDIPCHLDPLNAGRLIVKSEDLLAFVDNSNSWRSQRRTVESNR